MGKKILELKQLLGLMITVMVFVLAFFMYLLGDYTVISIGLELISLLVAGSWMVLYFRAQDTISKNKALIENLKVQEKECIKLSELIEKLKKDNASLLNKHLQEKSDMEEIFKAMIDVLEQEVKKLETEKVENLEVFGFTWEMCKKICQQYHDESEKYKMIQRIYPEIDFEKAVKEARERKQEEQDEEE